MLSCTFWHVSRKHFARCTCQNMLESTFAFCLIGLHQSFFNKRKHVRACFSKSAFAKTCFVLLKIRLAHQSSKKQKCFRARFGMLAESILLVALAETCSKLLLLFARLVCTSHIFNKRKHVRACLSKSAFAKSSFARLVCARPYYK